MAHSCIENYIHLIFATKDREPLIVDNIEKRLHSYMIGIAKKRETPVLSINGTEDHVHVLIKLHPAVALSTLMKEVKAYSSGWIKKIGYNQFNWQEGYGAFSCSKSHIQPIMNYIENQKTHHRRYSLQQEIDLFNEKWGTTWLKD